MSSSRQLSAIMFTDIVGYTALMGEDEQKAFKLLHKNRQIQQPIIKRFNGTLIKELGDGILAIFKTATDAVLCADAIQQACASVSGLQLRIGIHLGEVIFEHNDVFGDSVNIASRLQALAPIGGIWISEAVHKNIANKKGVSSTFVRHEALKNVKEPVPVYEVHVEIIGPQQSEYSSTEKEPHKKAQTKSSAELLREKFSAEIKEQSKEEKNSIYRTSNIQKRKIITWLVPAFILAVLSILFVPRWMKIQTARNKWIPEIQKMAAANFLATKAFDLAKETEKYIPDDSNLLKLWPAIAYPFSFQTNPAGAAVYWKDYDDVKGQWKLLGKTPLKNTWIPLGFTRIKIEKAGFITLLSPPTVWRSELNIKLDSISTLPENMVKVTGSETAMLIVGVERYGGKYVNDFLMDKYEVTNKEFKRFIDAGGYQNKIYWDYPIYSEGEEIPWEKAMDLFHDKTGKPGPGGWEVGTYIDGKDNHPVTGVSWYEAMAYAKFAGKKLPTVYHWSMVANTINTWGIIPKSNFNNTGTVPVGSMEGISDWGVYDIGGNAREWCFNESEKKDERFILGGGWNDPTYAYNDAGTQPAMDRSLSNGFRCMKELAGDTSYNMLSGNLNLSHRDYAAEKPVNDETFNIFLRQYVYDSSPLNPEISLVKDTSICKIEKIDIDAAYNKERMTAYLFLPKSAPPPYQTIVFFPGSGVMLARKFDYAPEMAWSFDF
ncbi:MAG TPA: SUMF1/EgtB/PvdO family nonheme iron enzyme, partial [Chitinophagaceae bacterium]